MFNPSRLIIARKRRKLTSKALADMAGISAVHLSRIEQGKAENIEQSTIDSLSEALKFPVDFFYGKDIDIPTPDTVSFRSLSAMTARERDSALMAGSFAYLIADWVSERFNLPDVDLPNLEHENDPATAAKVLRSYWGIGEKPIQNVIKLLEAKGVRIFSLSEETKNFDAFSCWRNGIPYIFLNTFGTAERSRFDALHELGHLILHRNTKPQGRQAEIEADNFASHFLMPSMDLMGNIRYVTSLNQLIGAKSRWGASVSALAYRLHKSNILSDWQYRTFCIQINKQYGRTEPNGLPRERSTLWDMVFRSLWEERITQDHVAKELRIPNSELYGLIFNLIDNQAGANSGQVKEKPNLKLA